jgi:hypothetical protein
VSRQVPFASAKRKKFPIVWIFLAIFTCALLLFRKSLAILAVQALLQGAVVRKGGELSYREMVWKGERLCISGFELKGSQADISVDEIQIAFRFDWRHLLIEPHVSLFRPQIVLMEHKKAFAFPSNKRFRIKWEVQDGIVRFLEHALYPNNLKNWEFGKKAPQNFYSEQATIAERQGANENENSEVKPTQLKPNFSSCLGIYFSFKPGVEWGKIGSLELSDQPEEGPVLSAVLEAKEETIRCAFQLEKFNCSRIAPFLTLLTEDPHAYWNEVDGEATLSGVGVFSSDLKLIELSCDGDISHLHLSSPSQGAYFACDLLQGHLVYPQQSNEGSFWEQIRADLVMEGVQAQNDKWGVSGIRGRCRLESGQDPELILDGSLIEANGKFPFHLEGRGRVQEEGTFWFQGIFLCQAIKGEELKAHFSLCSQEIGQYVCQIDCSYAGAEHLQLAYHIFSSLTEDRIPIQCVEGNATGKLTIGIEQGEVVRADLDEMVAHHLRLYFPDGRTTAFIENLQAELALKKEKEWEIAKGNLLIQEGDLLFSYDSERVYAASHIQGIFSVAHQQLLPSTIEGQLGDIKGKIDFNGPEAERFLNATFSGNAGEFLALFSSDVVPVDLPCVLQSSIVVSEQGVQWVNACEIGKESIYCGFEFANLSSLIDLDWTEGWFRAEQMSEETYVPLVSLWKEMALSGCLNLFGTFDRNKLQFSLETETEFSLSHPSLALICQKGHSVLFAYDLKEQTWSGTIPLIGAQIYCKELDLFLKDVHATFLVEGSYLSTSSWRFSGGFSQLSTSIDAEGLLSEGKCVLSYDSAQDQLSIENVEGDLVLGQDRSYRLRGKQLTWSPHQNGEFDIKVEEGKQEIGRIAGSFKRNGVKGWDMICDPQRTHLFGTLLQLDRLSLDLKTKLAALEMSPVLKTRSTSAEWKMKAILQGQEKGISIIRAEGNWGTMAWKGSGQYDMGMDRLSCQIDSMTGDLSALPVQELLPFSQCQGYFEASLNATCDLADLLIDGQLMFVLNVDTPFPVTIKNNAPLQFGYSSENGLKADNLQLQLYRGRSLEHMGIIKSDELRYENQVAKFQRSTFFLSPELISLCMNAQLLPAACVNFKWESYLSAAGDLSLGPSGACFQGTLKDGNYGIRDQVIRLEQIVLGYDKSVLSCRFKTQLGQKPLWGYVQVDLKDTPYGMIKLFDAPKTEGIKALFRMIDDQISWERIQGSVVGLGVDLVKKGPRQAPGVSLLTGTIEIDGSRLEPLLPEKFKDLKVGPGYRFQGDLILYGGEKRRFQIDGLLTGQNFELFGYRFGKLDTTLHADREHLLFSNLKIEDDAGLFTIKKVEMEQREDDRWAFYIPLLQARELRPSLMKKLSQPDRTIKPLVIKNISLVEVRGDLFDQLSWEGRGTSNFTNAFKKEITLFDAPFEMIKNLGLDLGILTPVQGEVELELRGDKFYLTHLKNAFSEGKRSQFFLSPANETSYIDFDGKLHIDIQISQDVVLKFAEAFTLTIRGTVDKPRYGLVTRRS